MTVSVWGLTIKIAKTERGLFHVRFEKRTFVNKIRTIKIPEQNYFSKFSTV